MDLFIPKFHYFKGFSSANAYKRSILAFIFLKTKIIFTASIFQKRLLCFHTEPIM